MNLQGVLSIHWRNVPGTEMYPGVPGIRKRVLWKGSNGATALILEIDAGSKFPELDEHKPGPEEVFVVSGVFNDGAQDHPAGTFLHHPAGSSHIPQSREGCVLFVFFPEG